ncbi:MAG: HAMP domain-containing protein [Acidobacteriia bacterium]|nr:HAMP domain-containing protein [Terriglobia bacterium]
MLETQDHSISRKLTWMNMFVSGAALLLACAAFIGYERLTFRETMVRNLSTQAQIVGSNSVSALVFNDPQSAENTLSALKAAPNVLSAVIYGPDGRPFASYSRDRDSQVPTLPAVPAGQAEAYWITDKQVVLVRSIVFGGKPTGTVYIRSDVQELNQRLKRYAGIAGIVLAVSLLAALVVSSIFRRSVAEPIVRLADIAKRVSREKNYSVRATPIRSQGELAILIDSFNEMLAQIDQNEKDLRKAHDELEQRVQERTAELAAANKELEAFSYSVSHDLRAPLRSIDGFSQALLEDYADKLDPAGRDCLKRVRSATQRMSQLIDDLLNLSRVTRAEMRREKVDLSALARSITEELRKGDPARRVELTISDGLMADADSRLLRVVMENLLGNAWKYTSTHDHAQIEFGQAKHNGRPAYFVRDDGAGFDPRYVGRLFGAFQRLHGATEFPGTGIGLATVQRIIHRHGGDVWAEGAVEHGATFYFTL